MATDPVALGFIAAVMMLPTWLSLRPFLAAFARSTLIWMYGCVFARLLDACDTTDRFCTLFRIADAELRRSASVDEVISTSISLDPSPPWPDESSMSPAPGTLPSAVRI